MINLINYVLFWEFLQLAPSIFRPLKCLDGAQIIPLDRN